MPDFCDNTVSLQEETCRRVLEGANRPELFAGANHIRLTKVSRDYAEGELEIVPASLNPLGIVHGGCLATLADTVAGSAVYAGCRACVTLGCSMNYLAPATGKKIKCVATPQKQGATICVYDCLLTNDKGETVASGTFTFYVMNHNPFDRG